MHVVLLLLLLRAGATPEALTMRLCWRAAWNMSVHMPALWTPLG